MLEKEYKFFIDHRDEFIKKHKNKYIVIKDEQVLGVYNSINEAAIATTKDHPLGTFIIQQCIPADQSVQYFHSRVAVK